MGRLISHLLAASVIRKTHNFYSIEDKFLALLTSPGLPLQSLIWHTSGLSRYSLSSAIAFDFDTKQSVADIP